MSGKPKIGLDYAAWNTDIFNNDTKIDCLLDAQGWLGFSIYFYLCQKAYASDGYFYRWSYANAATTARKMGGGIGSEIVKQTVGTCSSVGLFDKRLLDREGILTSKGIQRNYVYAISKRRNKNVDGKYWLLSKEESGSVIVVPANDHLQTANDHLQTANDPNSIVKDSIVNNTSIVSIPLKDDTEYEVSEEELKHWVDAYPDVDIKSELLKMKAWCIDNPSNRKTKRGIKRFIGGWLNRSQTASNKTKDKIKRMEGWGIDSKKS